MMRIGPTGISSGPEKRCSRAATPSPAQIAGELGIALQTVRVHLNAVRHAYRAPNLATALARLARDVLAAEEADPRR